MQIQCQIARRIIEDTTKKTIIESSLHVFIRFESVSRLQLFELQLNLTPFIWTHLLSNIEYQIRGIYPLRRV